ncbi:MAG: ATP-binding protein [Clostridia bacterium]|nr:ATP-binding protein [Clostridia bacterium]
MKKMILTAEVDRMDDVLDFINAELESHDVPMKTIMQIDIAVEELFVNIAHYAYNPDVGEATVAVDVEEAPPCAVIRFIDRGKPYDPLSREDPDVTLGVEERQIGGLGIYMVKKSMDEVVYTYEDGQNILTIRKLL